MDMTQAQIIFNENNVIKKYDVTNPKNKYSTFENEIKCLEKFSKDNEYSPLIYDINLSEKSYVMKKYSNSLGNKREIFENNLRRVLFTLSPETIKKQLDEIYKVLQTKKIYHRDINPGNILFSEDEKSLKLIDFYWATFDINTQIPSGGLNPIYGTNDKEAIEKIKNEIDKLYSKINLEISLLKKTIKEFGKKYYDGSMSKVGMTYQMIDLPYFRDIKYQRDISNEFKEMDELINNPISSVIDIGCASAYSLFNFLRKYNLKVAIGYEADPLLFNFLNNLKNIFRLDSVKFINGLNTETEFDKVDLVICMNVHMWLYKQFGNNVDLIMKKLIENSKEMFFQTAGLESNGKFLVKKFTSKEVIKEYLNSLTNKKVSFIRTTNKHGGSRHLFKIG
jgi:serine/threonine protein kinase